MFGFTVMLEKQGMITWLELGSYLVLLLDAYVNDWGRGEEHYCPSIRFHFLLLLVMLITQGHLPLPCSLPGAVRSALLVLTRLMLTLWKLCGVGLSPSFSQS